MSYAAEAFVSAPPPPSKPAAAKSAPQQPRATDEPSFSDHLAAETDETAPPATATAPRAEPVQDETTAPADAATGEPLPDQSVEAAPQPIQQPAPALAPIATPVMVQLIASDAPPAENTAPVQAAPVAPDAAPDVPQAPIAPPTQNAAPDTEAPAEDFAAPVPVSHAKPDPNVKAEAAPTADVKPQVKNAATETAPQHPVTQDAPAEAPVDTQVEAQVQNSAPHAEPPQTPPPNVVVTPTTPAPTRPVNAKANTETGETSENAPVVTDGETPAPIPVQRAAPRPVNSEAPVERVTPEAARDEASVQEKFAAALEKASRSEAKANVDRAPTASTQAAAVDAAPALASSAAPESMSATAPVTALSAATTHAAAQTQAMNADHVSRAAPASTQVSQEIVRRFDGGNTKFELRLDPPELGRVEVRLEVTRDHKVTAVIAADSPQALTELARHARDLEQSLQSAGLELTDNGLSFDLRQSREDTQDQSGDGRGSRGGASDDEILEQAAPLARPIGLERWRGVRVDVMA